MAKRSVDLVVENGICKLYSENGILQETGNAQGWSLLGGNYSHLKDGALLKNVSRRLSDGKWYGFDATGKMRTNIIADGRFYGKTGAAQTGWFTVAWKMVLCIISECFVENRTSCDQWS